MRTLYYVNRAELVRFYLDEGALSSGNDGARFNSLVGPWPGPVSTISSSLPNATGRIGARRDRDCRNGGRI